MVILALLLIGHALADYPLQGDWIAKAKNHKLDLVPGEVIWLGVLVCHASIHAAFVWAITGSGWLGLAEFVAHAVIDYAKSDGRLTYNQDQLLHVLCKVVWFTALTLLMQN
ncbi:conserved hypothetical protein [Rhizobium leguminosarum bv. trifolii WSM2304]|uniref:DUF3307 domain-containing protein n=1 Tax=Rhizobium leguminosarum bv. trifolii (strain WSM2304) TaxID=395492 RepID=A0ABF7QKV7_RHILW|nr:DUF3307 domain-containing protein [Rhizobium leguminosarum]ACI54432.1 conserved hypothetical protein [Rhizobium leguminosarum bv. trifolii WSM2304]